MTKDRRRKSMKEAGPGFDLFRFFKKVSFSISDVKRPFIFSLNMKHKVSTAREGLVQSRYKLLPNKLKCE